MTSEHGSGILSQNNTLSSFLSTVMASEHGTEFYRLVGLLISLFSLHACIAAFTFLPSINLFS